MTIQNNVRRKILRLREKNHSYAAIKTLTGVSEPVIRKLCETYGLVNENYVGRFNPYSDEKKAAVLADRLKGTPLKTLEKKHGVSVNTVRKWVKDLGVDMRRSDNGISVQPSKSDTAEDAARH